MTEAIWVSVADLWKRSNQGQEQLLSTSDSALESIFLGGRATQYGALVALVICIYDYMLTIGDEVELLWAKMDYKLAKILYLLSRYLPLIALTWVVTRNNPVSHTVFSDANCKASVIIVALAVALQNVISILVFGLRQYALYYDNKSFRRVMVVVFALGVITLTILAVFIARTTAKYGKWSDLLGACITSPSKANQGALVTSLILEAALAATTVWHAITSAHYRRDLSESPIVSILNSIYLQGGLYFLVIFTCRIINTFMLWLGSGSHFLVNVYVEYALSSIITVRWILALQQIISQTALTKSTITLPSHRSPSLQFHQAGISGHRAHSRARRGRDGHPGRSRDHVRSQSVSANINFVGGASTESYIDSRHYSSIVRDIRTNGSLNDYMWTIQETDLIPVDESGINLKPLNTLSKIEGTKVMPSQRSVILPIAGPNTPERDSSGYSDTPVSGSNAASTSAAGSTATVGVRANSSAESLEEEAL